MHIHQPVFCIIPPHILEQIAQAGTPAQREMALQTLKESEQLRGQRRALVDFLEATNRVRSEGKDRLIYNANNNSSLPGKIARKEGDPPLSDEAINEAYDGSGATYDLFRNVYNRNSIDNNGMRLVSTINYGKDYCNSFWNGEQMVYGVGDKKLSPSERLFNRFTIAIDIIGHELTHGVIQFEAQLVYSQQPGALNESMSDVFGSLVKQYHYQQSAADADWIIGQGLFTDNINGIGIRSMKAPGTAYDDPVLGRDPQPGHMSDYINTTSDNGGVHLNSGIPNHAFYVTANEIGGYAWEKAGQIWYIALRDKLSASTNFQNAADMLFQTAGEIFGEKSIEQQAVGTGWAEVGVKIDGYRRTRARRKESKPTAVDPASIQFREVDLRARVLTDIAGGPDKLDYTKYAKAFADLITNPEMNTPVTIGIYGEWGAGKSFLMGKIKEAVLQPKVRQGGFSSIWREIIQNLRRRESAVDVKIIEFNAWVYSGSEHLWASLVSHLYREIERYFGVRAHMMRLSKALRKSLPQAFGAFAFYALLGLLLSLLVGYQGIKDASEAVNLAVKALAGSLIGGSALASLPALWSALRNFFDNLFLSRANKLQKLALQPDFRAQIGIMADIKEEIRFIRKLLERGKRGKPTRLVLLIDDLDRCDHEKAVEVLQAIMLLLADEDGSPCVIILGIDARVVIKAIEERYGAVLVKAGINGYEYLDKIIQIPFAIPAADQGLIENYVDSLIWSSEDERNKVQDLFEPKSQTSEPKQQDPDQTVNQAPDQPTDTPTASQTHTPKTEPKSVFQDIPVTFTKPERDALKGLVSDLVGNPRKIKRIINIYRLARLLISRSIEEQKKMIRWILLIEQWPLHMSWILEYIENDIQTSGKTKNKNILGVYRRAKKSIYNELEDLVTSIDADPDLFLKTIKKKPILTVEEIVRILPFTFNLNPAVRSEVSKKMIQNSQVTQASR